MKIAYVCNFSYPFWEGVWNNVYHLAKAMIAKGHEVHVFSSNANPAGEKSAPSEIFEGIHIHRFEVRHTIGSYGLFFDFEPELEKIKPDVIHAHVYRNPGAHKALLFAQKFKIPCFLTTHAPFERKRSFLAGSFVKYYDFLLGRKILNSYTKVIAITKWEMPHLEKLGLQEENTEYIPNGVEAGFFLDVNKKKAQKVVYLGRLSAIKNLDVIVKCAKEFPHLQFELIGPLERGYNLASESSNLSVVNRKYNAEEEIAILKESDIYILPSKSEGFPQTLLEAMAAGKLVIASGTKGATELVREDKNGFLFYDFNDLKRKLHYCVENYEDLTEVRKNAQITAQNFLWSEITQKTLALYEESLR